MYLDTELESEHLESEVWLLQHVKLLTENLRPSKDTGTNSTASIKTLFSFKIHVLVIQAISAQNNLLSAETHPSIT